MREVDQELFDAVKQGNLGRIKRCLDRGANIHARSLLLGYEPIHLAAREGHQEVVEFFLGRRASVNDSDKNNYTPLHYAAQEGQLGVAKFLVKKGANIGAKNSYGKTPLDIAREERHMEIVNILDGIETEVTESESSSVCSSLEDSQEVQESDEEYFESERDELEAAKKDIIEHLKHRCSDVFTLRGKNRGKNYWHYILIDSGKEEVFLEQCKTGLMDAADYGKILYSGWGENPPQNIEDKVDEFFNKKVSNDLFVIKEERKNKNAYHYVLIDPDKREMFLEQSKTGSALARDIEDYGRILYSGWGQDPPESIPDRIARAYFCTNERDLEGEFANLSVKDDNALYDAARNGELETVKYIIKKGVNVNSADQNGWTSLHHAAYGGNLEVVKCLIDSRADLHVEDTVCGRKPVHIAAREGNTGIVRLFLSKGVRANDVDKNSWTPLNYAAWNGHLGTAKLLINKGADIHAKDAIRGKKPIHIAAEGGYTNVVELFLSSGVSIDDTDKEGRALLYYAAWKGHLETVKFLAGKGANIHAKNTYGTKPIHVATMEGHREIIEFLLSKGVDVDDTNKNGWTPLHCAAQEGKLGVAEFLISKGANIHAKDDTKAGKKPIHVAAIEGHMDVVEFFLSREVSVDDADKEGRTSLYYAARNGHSEAVKFLAGKGANIHAENIYGAKPIHAAAIEGHQRVIEFLLSKEVDVDNTDKNGWTSLHYAAGDNQLKVAEFLVSKGADIHAKSNDGKTPVHITATGGHREIIEFLLSKGASVDDTDKNGWTSLHYAAGDNQLKVAEFLVSKGANIHAKNNDGKTPLDIAREEGHTEIVERLTSRIAEIFNKQGKYNKARQAYQEVLDIQEVVLGPNHPGTLRTRHSIAVVLKKQGKYTEARQVYQEVIDIQKTSIKLVKQGLYLPSFRKRGMKMMGKCSEITRGLSQALFLQSNKSFLNNLGTSVEIYERIAQGKQISEREEREVFALSKLLDNFRQQLIAPYSLPPSLMHTVGYKIPRDLSNYIAEIEGDFAIHLITSNHVVAIYRVGDNYAYFDSNIAFVSGLKNVDQLMDVVGKRVKSAGYQVEEKGFLVEHFDVDKANSQLSNEDKQILAKEIKTERQLLAEQDKELGFIEINGQEVSRVQLYDFGTKINVEGGVPLLINADMNLSSKKLQDHLDKKEVSMTAREYLDNLKNGRNMEGAIQATRLIPFEGSRREIEKAEQTRNLKGSSLEQLAKGTINSILAAVSLRGCPQTSKIKENSYLS